MSKKYDNIDLDLNDDELYTIIWMHVDKNFEEPSKQIYDEIIKDKEDIKDALFCATLNDIIIKSLREAIEQMENDINEPEKTE